MLHLLALLAAGPAAAEGIVVIGNANVPKLDAPMIQKLFTGRIVELDGVSVTVVNAPAGNPLRNRFLATFLGQSEDQYTAYWTVRQFVGRGRPPKELATSAEVISFVQSRPGAIGYIDSADLVPGLRVLVSSRN